MPRQKRAEPAVWRAARALAGDIMSGAYAVGSRLPVEQDLAVRLDCDGVHVGQEDMRCAEARRIVGPDRQVGVTARASRHLAMEAAEAGADYVAFGAFFPSTTKPVAAPAGLEPADLEIVEWWSELMEIPCVATGGITVGNAAPVIAAGADFLAVAGGVWDHKDGPEAAVRAFNALFAAAGS